MLTEAVKAIIAQTVAEKNPDAFLVDVSLKRSKLSTLSIRLDTDRGISLAECSQISRALGRLLEDHKDMDFPYRLEVSSPGVGFPLKLHRQYIQNINRHLSVQLLDGREIQGKLLVVEEESITLEPLAAPKKGRKKGAKPSTEEAAQQQILFREIKESKVIIVF